ncbi:MAG: lamin tail domain-containing protein [Roseibacillus sp.]|nr:lamin tail domain-containing protein [Roseibacillus sp.]
MRLIATALLMSLAPLGAVPLISEFMFHPPHLAEREDPNEEWLEIYNPGPGSVALQNWTLSGVGFTFPPGNTTTIPENTYLVVAADVATFRARHQGVTNVVGDWSGGLSNRSETIQLLNPAGVEIDRVKYADGGDWALRRPGPDDLGHRGWIWQNPADAGSKSMELRNLLFSNNSGQNWAPSLPDYGTPGQQNSVFSLNIPPLIEEVSHHPAVPGPNDLVLVRARITDDISSPNAVVHHRISSLTPGNFLPTAMRDDGLGGDERAGDGIHTALLPAQPNGTVVEFFVEALDPIQSRTWPAPTSATGTQGANLLYQVDRQLHRGRVPFYRLILTKRESEEYLGISFETAERNTNARFNATFIAQLGDSFTTFYQCGIRLRGSGSRSRYPRNIKVELPSSELWQGYDEFNLNTQFTYNQLLGSLFYREAGLPVYESKAVQVRMNGINHAAPENAANGSHHHHHYGMYVHNEPVNRHFVRAHYPLDANGNLYRMAGSGTRWEYFPASSDLAASYTGAGWDKENNSGVNDWTDLHEFIRVLSTASGPGYLDQIKTVMDLESWLRNLAVSTILTNGENSLFTGRDDDYVLYRGNEGTFKLIPHDLDTILGEGDDDSSIEIADLPFTILDVVEGTESFEQLEPLFNQPEVLHRYYEILAELLAGPFEETRANALIDDALTWTPPGVATTAKEFLAARRTNILNLIQSPLSATATPEMQTFGGYPFTETGLATLAGTCNLTQARSIHVNGTAADIDLRAATWSFTAGNLNPGINRLVVEERDADNNVLSNTYFDVYYDDGDTSAVGGLLTDNTTLDAASGPWIVTPSLVVPPGLTLTIEPGTSLFFEPGAGITVQPGATLHCEGEAYNRIRLSRTPGSSGRWQGLNISAPPGQSSLTDNVISYSDMEYGDDQGESILLQRSRLLLDHLTWDHCTDNVLELTSPQLELRDCVFPFIRSTEAIHGDILIGDDYFILRRNLFVPTTGYNDIIDFTGGRRPGPILTAYDNIFTGATDDCFDLDGSDAHLEGNIFMHVHQDTPRNSSSNAISTDLDSHLTVIRNLFFDVDHALLLINESDGVFLNNTVVQATIAAIHFDEPARNFPPGESIRMDSNLFVDCAATFANALSVFPEPNPTIIGHRNNLPSAHLGIGIDNLDLDPFLDNPHAEPWPKSNWALLPGSPAIGTGHNGLDRGALIPRGAQVSGLPPSRSRLNTAVLRVSGPGILAYRFRLVTEGIPGPWSTDQQLGAGIFLTALPEGRHRIDLLAKDSAGYWQEAADFTSSREWQVDPSAPIALLLNEVEANSAPGIDSVELHNPSNGARSLKGWSLTDNPNKPNKRPLSGTIGAGSFRTFSARDVPGLSARGETLFLFQGNTLVDIITWGLQAPGFSIGRVGPEANWSLTIPSPNLANQRSGLAPVRDLKINEWLAEADVRYAGEFVELYNPGDSPAALGGLGISDSPDHPFQHQLREHTYLEPGGFLVLWATGLPSEDADNLPFTFEAFREWIVLTDLIGATIDQVAITCQPVDVVEGRNPNGSLSIESFSLGTPGRSNNRTTRRQLISTPLAFQEPGWRFLDHPHPDPPAAWNTALFDDAAWKVGPAPLGHEDSALLVPLATHLTTDPAFVYHISRKNYHFRHPFEFSGNPTQTTLMLETSLDDGAVFFLNGELLYRHNIQAGPLTENTWAHDTISNAVFEGPFPVPSKFLLNGTNTLAVVTYQATSNSSDIVFDCELTASETLVVPPTPTELAHQELLDNLRITELMYNPPDGNNGEFVEVTNISETLTLDLTGVRFTRGITFTFPAMDLAPGGQLVVVRDPGFFRSIHRDVPDRFVAGAFDDSRFDNDSEMVALTLPEPWNVNIQQFTYFSTWHPTTDTEGRSLELRDAFRPLSTWNERSAWIPSIALHGSPAAPNGAASFEEWSNLLGAGLDDPDGDTHSNPIEYAFGLDPFTRRTIPILALNPTAGEGLTSTFLFPAVAPGDVTVRIQSSTDLEFWTTEATRISNGPWTGSDDFESVTPASGFGVLRLHHPATLQWFTRIVVDFAP